MEELPIDEMDEMDEMEAMEEATEAVAKQVQLRLPCVYDGYKGLIVFVTNDGTVCFGRLPFQHPIPRLKMDLLVHVVEKQAVLDWWKEHEKALQRRIVKESKRISYKWQTNLSDVQTMLKDTTSYLKIVQYSGIVRAKQLFLNPTATALKTRLNNMGCFYDFKAQGPVAAGAAAETVLQGLKRQQSNLEERRKGSLSKNERKMLMSPDQKKVVFYYLSLMKKPLGYLKLLKYYTGYTVEYILDTSTEERCEKLFLYANVNSCKEASREIAPDIPLYKDSCTIQLAYKQIVVENLSIWKQLYTPATFEKIKGRTGQYLKLLEGRRQRGDWVLQVDLMSPWFLHDPLTNHEQYEAPTLKEMDNKFMFLSDFNIVEALCRYLLMRSVKICNGGLPDLSGAACKFLDPNLPTKKQVQKAWPDDSKAFGEKAPRSVLVLYTERWSMKLLLARIRRYTTVSTVYLHFGDEIMTASDLNIANLKPDIETLVEKVSNFENVDTRVLEAPSVVEEEEEMEGEAQRWMESKKNNSSYVLAPSRYLKRKLLEKLKKKGDCAISRGTELCKLCMEPKLYFATKDYKWPLKHTVIVDIATYPEVSIFDRRPIVYCVGGPWSKEMHEKAKRLCTEKLILVSRKADCGLKSPWNHYTGGEFKPTFRQSGFYELYMKLYREKQDSERVLEEVIEEEAEQNRIARLKATAKELAATRKRTAEAAELLEQKALEELFGED